jgi:hypothetical protein
LRFFLFFFLLLFFFFLPSAWFSPVGSAAGTASCAALRRAATPLFPDECAEALIGFLREADATKYCIVILRHVRKLSLAEAQDIVHFSPTWSDTKASNEKLQENLINAMIKAGFKTD